MQNELKVGSLFSGIGGIEIGFEKQGFKTEWFVEWEPYQQEVLRKRFPNTKIYGDITKIDFRTVPKIDILTGGFPCQDISQAGKGIGIEGSRSSHWKYYSEAIRILQPRYALIENVSALAILGLNKVLSDLAKIGYDAEWYNLSASSVGAFHKRERIFIIAYPHSNRQPDESFNEDKRQGIVGQLSNSYGKGSERQGKNEIRQELLCSGEYSWGSEPRLDRVADGIPNRLERIECLGNAVVPQCAEVFARAIKMMENKNGV